MSIFEGKIRAIENSGPNSLTKINLAPRAGYPSLKLRATVVSYARASDYQGFTLPPHQPRTIRCVAPYRIGTGTHQLIAKVLRPSLRFESKLAAGNKKHHQKMVIFCLILIKLTGQVRIYLFVIEPMIKKSSRNGLNGIHKIQSFPLPPQLSFIARATIIKLIEQ